MFNGNSTLAKISKCCYCFKSGLSEKSEVICGFAFTDLNTLSYSWITKRVKKQHLDVVRLVAW
jgi:hypothetical protein